MELVVRLVRIVNEVLLVYPAYEQRVLSHAEFEEVFPRSISPHLAVGQTDELIPCVGIQSILQAQKSV
jgi:phosphoketolase